MEKIEINIYIFGIEQNLFEELFPEKKNNRNNEKGFIIEERFRLIEENKDIHEFHSLIPAFICSFLEKKIYYKGYKCVDILDNNKNNVFFSLYNELNKPKNKNTIIIKFGDSYIKEFSTFMNKIKNNKPFILFILNKSQINNNLFNTFKEPQFISYIETIENNNNQSLLYNKILNYFYQKVCYFFDLGKSPCHFFSPKGFLEYNILLIGESRAGKSTFINRIYNKLVTHEGNDLESMTKKVKEFKIYLKDSLAGINLLDSPGIVAKADFGKIKNELDHHINEIHLIYFFIKGQSTLDVPIEFLKYIKEKNSKMMKEGKYKIPIIFIKNGEDLKLNNEEPDIFKTLKNCLKKHNLLELYDSTINIKQNEEENKIEINEDNFLDEDEEIFKNYDNYINGNIIQIYLPTGKNINRIFTLTKEYLLKYNKYIFERNDEEIQKLKNDVTKLIQFFIKKEFEKIKLTSGEIKKKNELFIKCNDYVNNIKKKCSLLYNLKILEVRGEEKYIKKVLFFSLALIPYYIGAFLPSFFIKKINESYDSFCKFISYTAIQFGFDDKDIKDYNLLNYIIEYTTEGQKIKDKEKINEKTFEIFSKIIEYIGPSQCLIRTIELSGEILKVINFLENKNDWNSFEIEKI